MEVNRAIKESLIKEKRNVVVLILLVFYAFTCNGSISFLQKIDVSYGGYALAVFTDHYYITYGLILYFLYWLIKDIRGVSDQEKIRYGTYRKFYAIRLVTTFIKISIYILAHIVVVLVTGIGRFRWGIDLNVTKISGSSLNGTYGDVLLDYGKKFPNAIGGIVLSALWLIMGMFFIYVLVFYSYEIKGMVLAVPMMIIIIMSINVGFRLNGTELVSMLFLNKYLIFHHLFLYECWPIYAILAILIVCMITLWLHLITVWYKTRKDTFKSKEYTEELMVDKKIIYIFIAAYLALFLFNTIKYKGISMDFILNTTMGFAYNGTIDIISVINYVMYFVCPIFLLGSFLENERQDKYIIAKARYGRKKNWDSLVLFNSYRFMLIYWALMMLAQVVIMTLLLPISITKVSDLYTFFLTEYRISGSELVLYIFGACIIRIFELIIIFEIMYILLKKINNVTICFLVPFMGYIVSLIIKVNSNINPFGAGALSNLVEKSKNEVIITLFSSIVWMILLIIIRKKVSCKREGKA